jgi:surface protein
MEMMFQGLKNFNQSLPWNVSNVRSIKGLFYDAPSFNMPIGDWDTSNVQDMSLAFFGASSFNQDIGKWDTSQVVNMAGPFVNASAFNQPLNWDTSRVVDMSWLFSYASSFNQNLSSWDTSSVEDTCFITHLRLPEPSVPLMSLWPQTCTECSRMHLLLTAPILVVGTPVWLVI